MVDTWQGHWLGGVGVHHGVTFNLALPKCVHLPSFSYDKEILIAPTDYYMHFYIIVLFPFTTILQFIIFPAP